MNSANAKVALVTGATRGVGKGVAVGLAAAGFSVYATGRSAAQTDLGRGIVPVSCDSTDAVAIARVFGRIEAERGRLDVLVNSAWGGYERMVEDGQFTWPAPFWLQPLWRWEAMIAVGVRGAFVASQHAARLMVPARQGLIVHLSSWAARSTSAMSRTALQRRRPTSWRPTWRTSSSLMASLLCQCTQVLSEPRRCWPQVSSI